MSASPLPPRYQEFLRRARTENFSDLAGLGAFYKAGQDYLGRQVIVFVGNKFPAPKVDLTKVSQGVWSLGGRGMIR